MTMLLRSEFFYKGQNTESASVSFQCLKHVKIVVRQTEAVLKLSNANGNTVFA